MHKVNQFFGLIWVFEDERVLFGANDAHDVQKLYGSIDLQSKLLLFEDFISFEKFYLSDDALWNEILVNQLADEGTKLWVVIRGQFEILQKLVVDLLFNHLFVIGIGLVDLLVPF